MGSAQRYLNIDYHQQINIMVCTFIELLNNILSTHATFPHKFHIFIIILYIFLSLTY